MEFKVNTAVNAVFGKDCVKRNVGLLGLGKRAFIVCGKHGAKASGALDDVTSALDRLGIAYVIFDRSTENPPLELCFEGGKLCRESGADFVIGIGGGSALDAAKAVAAYAGNPGISPLDIYDKDKRVNHALPIVAVPTTSGTGSEANGTSVLSLPGGEVKKSFTADLPTVSFLDPKYTYSMPYRASLSCALDAFAHAAESYLSPKSTAESRRSASFAAKNIWDIVKADRGAFSEEEREILQVSAFAAGHAISVTGTGFPHPMGYSLTMLDGVPHGFACAAFYKPYIKYNETRSDEGNRLVNEFCRDVLGETPDTVADVIPRLAGVEFSFTEAEIEKRVSLIAGAKNYVNSPYVLTDEDKFEIYRKLFLKKEER